MESAARPLGLYLHALACPEMPMDPNEPITLIATYLVGDYAFTKEVQDPQAAKQDAEFHEMVGDPELESDFGADLAKEWKDRLKGEGDD